MSFVLAILLFLWQQEIIIIKIPQQATSNTQEETPIIQKNIILLIHHNHAWERRQQLVLWPSSIAEQIRIVLNTLLSLYHDERIIQKQTIVQSVAYAPSVCSTYISLTHNPLHRQWPIDTAWFFLQSCLYSIAINNISIKDVYFLVNNKPLVHQYINTATPFSVPTISEIVSATNMHFPT